MIRNILRAALPTICLFALSTTLDAQDQQPPKADNTRVNKRARSMDEPSADQQKMNKSDRELTKQIRQAVVADKSLSTYAHNVKIISQNGQVTLKGPVRSPAEKKAIEAKAVEIAGADKVTNELSVAPDSDTDREKSRKP